LMLVSLISTKRDLVICQGARVRSSRATCIFNQVPRRDVWTRLDVDSGSDQFWF
jgi:hypothetical protein